MKPVPEMTREECREELDGYSLIPVAQRFDGKTIEEIETYLARYNAVARRFSEAKDGSS